MMFVSDLLTKFSCTYCQDEISGVFIKCVECKEFALCLQCFAAGAEIGPHKNDHAYQFINSDAQDLFKSKGGWSGREELILLNGIEGYGFGNWKDIALKLENRTSEDCRDEYIRTFLEGNIGRATWTNERPIKTYNEVVSTAPPARIAPIDIKQDMAEELVYMPLRDDFETEFNNNAERIVSHLNISSEDDELDVALKLAQVDMYVEQLRERKRLKRIARDYQLVSKFFNTLYLRSKTSNHEEIELEEKLKFLCQFLTCQEFDSFIMSWLREVSLRRRASELGRYRQNGLTRFEEIPHFEQESCFRSDTKPILLLNPNTSPGRCPPLERATDCQAAGPSADLWTAQVTTQDYSHPPRLSPHHLPQLHQPQALPHPLARKSERSDETANYCSTGKNSMYPTDIPKLLQPTEQEQQQSQLHLQHSSNPFKFTDQPSHLLSSSESQICSSLDLTPSQLISIKTILLTKSPELSCKNAEKPILDYITSNNWFIS